MGVHLVEVKIAIGVSWGSFGYEQEQDAVWPVLLRGLRTSAAQFCGIRINVREVRNVRYVFRSRS
ncbi:hypothetical protein BHQ17_13370 [Mycolicibacterium holsaticum]|uniref:Uncharacterized protein n=1 Tax=Mycolicibacterium holsaticum TaxID=152142 RepID=A0A1E3RU33_9MYCO|nr:hypothetical protein BHQ17_13370 [Mycolicibacterium holsaticum]